MKSKYIIVQSIPLLIYYNLHLGIKSNDIDVPDDLDELEIMHIKIGDIDISDIISEKTFTEINQKLAEILK